jgi:hypothetical protein
MAKTKAVPTFDQVLATLGNEKFDVSPAAEGANRAAGAYRVSKIGCAAEIAPSQQKDAPVRVLTKAGWLVGGDIAILVDRGYQKFLKTSRLEIPATADALRALHTFEDQLKEAVGTTSDRYDYDRIKGR